MRSDELAAAALLAELLDCRASAHDRPEQGEGLYDWDLATPGGTTIAVEVTMHTDAAWNSFWSEKGEQHREVPGLDGTFIVEVLPSANRRDLWKHLTKLLPDLPANLVDVDIETARWGRLDPTPTSVEELLGSLGVTHVGFVPTPDHSAITLTTPGGGAIGPEVVVDAAMSELEPNRAKLAAAADATERHLFVWIDGAAFLASEALRGGTMPSSQAPDFGPGVDVMWVAAVDTSRRPVAASVLWRAESGGPWDDWTAKLDRTRRTRADPP